MTQPSTGPATLAGTKSLLGIADTGDDVELEAIAAAVNAVVRLLPVADVDAASWPANVTRGADMLAARLYRRKGSPSGVEAFGADGALYVSRNDPDIALLLRLGAYAPPAVG